MTEERSWTIACSLGSLGLMSCKSRAEDFARRLHTKLKTLGGLANEEDAECGDKSAAALGEHDRLVDVAADSACLPQPVQTCLTTEDDELFFDFDLDSPESPAAVHDLLHINPCDGLCNGGEEIRRKGGGGGIATTTGNGSVATSQPMSVMRETELYCHCTEHRDSGVGCRLTDISGEVSPPTPIVYTPPEEFPTDRESAYCSGGEQETNVLGQGQTNEGLTRALLERFSLHDSENEYWRNYDGGDEVYTECKSGIIESKLNDAMPIDRASINEDGSFQNGDGEKTWDDMERRACPEESSVFFGKEDTCDKLLTSADDHEQYRDDVSRQVLAELVKDACSVQNDGESNDIKAIDDDEVSGQDDAAKDCGSPVSPTWSSLKKIDRFQVRHLVNDDATGFNNTELENAVETAITADTIKAETETVENPEQLAAAPEADTKSEDVQTYSVQTNSGCVDEPSTTIILSVLVDQPTEPSPLSPISARLLDDRPRHIYRSSSLKTGKTPPGTPGRKKIVRFADVFGLDLEDVRHIFLDDLPQVPRSAYSDLDTSRKSNNCSQVMSSSSSANQSCSRPVASNHRPAKSLIAMFSQPCSSQKFLDRVKEQKVCLESAHVADVGITGSVRVLNLAFHKAVIVRYTLNEWRSFLEVEGSFVSGGSDSISDRFTFHLYGGETLGIGERIVFCIRYQTMGQHFWDNNHGQNYFFQCIADNYHLPPSPLDTWDLFL